MSRTFYEFTIQLTGAEIVMAVLGVLSVLCWLVYLVVYVALKDFMLSHSHFKPRQIEVWAKEAARQMVCYIPRKIKALSADIKEAKEYYDEDKK